MQPLSISQLFQRYTQLRGQLEQRQISQQQFVDQVQALRAQDQAGNWWLIDVQSGRYLTFTADGWIPGTPAAAHAAPAPAAGKQAAKAIPARPTPSRAPAITQARGGCRGLLGSPFMVGLLSFGSAAVWFAYSSLSPSSEGKDFTTPLIIAGVPLLLRLFQKPLDRLLSPLYKILGVIPRPLLLGAAVATPLLLGGVFTDSYGAGFQSLQRSAAFSVIIGYILSRRPPEVAR